jgi:hypothetical protein
MVHGSNLPYDMIKYGTYTLKQFTHGTIEYEIGKTTPEGIFFLRTNLG